LKKGSRHLDKGFLLWQGLEMGSSQQKGFGWPHVLFAILLFVVIGIIFTPIVLRESHLGDREVLNNAKAIASGLAAFREEYGTYPCAETREVLHKADKPILEYSYDESWIREADDANAYLAQLIVTDIIDDEVVFYASGVKGAIKGDTIKGTADTLLSIGKNSFIYLMVKDQKPLTDISSMPPLVMAPIKAKGEIPVFDPGPYADKYIYGAVDGSGKVGDIDQNGRAKSKGRTNLFQTGPDSLFGDQVPVVKYPLGF
jgi:hypothetical protein